MLLRGLMKSSFMQVIQNGDVNTMLEPGYFVINGNVINLPKGAYKYGTLFVYGVYRQRVVQMYMPDYFESDNKLYIRSINEEQIREWRTLSLT